ncbi:molybdenum cofactor biosynthesis protein MoaE [Parahaliea aestuarii]|uniref:Molybdopterin synthase catalytic subunit n=1 Tax=Parahaliea aestuarii TaxID=1852021 RepID=A0A5C8ZT93_9GAMM|nr:molybdenum cofactor biosynthesis protein MoaE [Parahaliea aestuarii]TXS90999.1 molybdenum cofactor biosynthesis protein MoaE [Parahaliea aestuarii]
MGIRVQVQAQDFDPLELQRQLEGDDAGAVVTFTGYVKAGTDAVTAIELEHYPGMTERSIEAIAREAVERWSLKSVGVVHRIGRLDTGAQIVWVGASALHRGEAFSGCEFVMDYLKTRAPFWKKEFGQFGEHWVEARDSDQQRAGRW